MDHEQETLKKLETDIEIIKKAISSNNHDIKRILLAPTFGSFFFFFGLAALLLPLCWDFMINRYGRLASIPTVFLVLLTAVTVISIATLTVWKTRAVAKAAQKTNPKSKWIDTLEALSEHPVFLNQMLIMAFTLFASILAFQRGNSHLVIPVVSLGMAIVFMLYQVSFLFNEYSFIMLWLFVFSAFSLLFPLFTPLVMTSIGFGGGFIIFGIAVYDFKGSKKRHG